MATQTITTKSGSYTVNICDRCDHPWIVYRKAKLVPFRCPKCRTRLWNRKAKVYISPKRITRGQLESAILPVNGKVPTLQELGVAFGVTRERIRQRLAVEGIRKPLSRQAARCPDCHGLLQFQYRHPKDRCRCKSAAFKVLHAPIPLICGSCGISFLLRPSEYRARYLRNRSYNGLRSGPRTTPPFCSSECWGRWVGKHHTHRQSKKREKSYV